jgi:hypothetical protein
MAVLGALGLGFVLGKLASGAKPVPFDGWILEGFNLAVIAGLIVWFANAAIKGRDDKRNSAHPS